MKRAFTAKRMGSSALRMIDTINDILAEYEKAGYDLSLRQCYYQLVARGLVENTERSYKNVGNIISDGRLNGLIDWNMIKDRGREVVCNTHWSSPAQIVKACAAQYKIDRWDNQPCYVEVMVEKQALEGVLLPVCQKWDVPFTANKGYSSSSAMYDAGRRIQSKLEDDKDVIVIYLGDHDPSGIDMTRDIEDRLRQFSENGTGDMFAVQRIALNMDQIEEMNPPKNPAKITDSRAQSYIKRFGRSSWELDAIDPKTLAGLVSSAIRRIVDPDAWCDSDKEQQAGRDALRKVCEQMEA